MTFGIVTSYDDKLYPLGQLTTATAAEYAKKNGYSFKAYLTSPVPTAHVYWDKVGILIKELPYADFTLWLDADALIVGRQRLEDIVGNSNFALSQDQDGICCGVMLLRNCEWTNALLRAWQFMDEVDDAQLFRYERKRLHDQSALKCLIANFPKIRTGVDRLPERLVMNPRAPYHPSPFIMHYWSSSGRLEEIINKVESFQKHGWTKDSYMAWQD